MKFRNDFLSSLHCNESSVMMMMIPGQPWPGGVSSEVSGDWAQSANIWPDSADWDTKRSPGRPGPELVHNLQAGLRAGKNWSWGYVFMWAKNALIPTFCVCIFLYLFIIIANVYFNVQISAKYYAERFKFLPNFLQILSWRNNKLKGKIFYLIFLCCLAWW